MGRTISKFHDDDDRRGKASKGVKHSKNIPGEGMRVINNWSEENDEDDMFEVDEYEDELYDEYNDYISQTQRK